MSLEVLFLARGAETYGAKTLLGEEWRRYAERTPMLILFTKRGRRVVSAS